MLLDTEVSKMKKAVTLIIAIIISISTNVNASTVPEDYYFDSSILDLGVFPDAMISRDMASNTKRIDVAEVLTNIKYGMKIFDINKQNTQELILENKGWTYEDILNNTHECNVAVLATYSDILKGSIENGLYYANLDNEVTWRELFIMSMRTISNGFNDNNISDTECIALATECGLINKSGINGHSAIFVTSDDMEKHVTLKEFFIFINSLLYIPITTNVYGGEINKYFINDWLGI